MLATMYFHFALNLLPLHSQSRSSQCWPKLLDHFISHYHGGLLNGYFQSLGNHLTTAWVHLLSVNFVMSGPAELLLAMLHDLSFIPLSSRITLLWMCLHNDVPCLDLSIVFFVITSLLFFLHGSPFYTWVGKTVFYWRVYCSAWPWVHLLW